MGELSEFILSRREQMPGAAVSAASSIKSDGGDYRVIVSLANPEHEEDLMTLASAVAKHHGGVVDAVHIVTVPDQTSLEYAADHLEEHEADHHAILDKAQADAETFGVQVDTHTIVSHRGFEEIFDAARTHDADTVVMGWGPDSHGSPGRAESAFDDLAMDLPCDFLVLKDRGFDPSRVLVPTAGGPDSDLSASVVRVLRRQYDSEVMLLHAAGFEAEGEAFLTEWAAEHSLEDATLQVETGDVEAANRARGRGRDIRDHRRDRTGPALSARPRIAPPQRRRGDRVFGVAGRAHAPAIAPGTAAVLIVRSPPVARRSGV